MFFIFIYVYWYPTRFLCQMMLVSLNSNTTGVTSGAETAYQIREFTSVLVGFLLLNHQVYVQCFVDNCLSFSLCHFSVYCSDNRLWYLQTFPSRLTIMRIYLLSLSYWVTNQNPTVQLFNPHYYYASRSGVIFTTVWTYHMIQIDTPTQYVYEMCTYQLS